MKFRNIIISLSVMLFLTGSGTHAQDWRWKEKYYKEHHTVDNKWYKEHNDYYRPWLGGIFYWGWGVDRRDYYYGDDAHAEYMDKYYNNLDKEWQDRHSHHYHYFDNDEDRKEYRAHYRDYRHYGHYDNYHPQVDDNK